MEFDMFRKPRANPHTKASRKKAGKKAAATRKRNHAKRVAAGKKAARTRKRHAGKRTRRNVSAGVGGRVGGLRAGVGARVSARSNPAGVSSARVTKIERKLTQVVKVQRHDHERINKLSNRFSRLDRSRKALGLPSPQSREDEIQERAVAMEMAARRKNPFYARKGIKKGTKLGGKMFRRNPWSAKTGIRKGGAVAGKVRKSRKRK